MDRAAVTARLAKALREKQQSLELMLDELNQAIADDTKSSAGDKFETSRAMAQQEIDKIQQQLAEAKRQQALLASFSAAKTATINAGSITETNHGIYFIGVPFGQIIFEGKTVFCISSASPLAQQLIGKRKKDLVQAGNTSHEILEIY